MKQKNPKQSATATATAALGEWIFRQGKARSAFDEGVYRL
jgi:hypothetical protein